MIVAHPLLAFEPGERIAAEPNRRRLHPRRWQPHGDKGVPFVSVLGKIERLLANGSEECLIRFFIRKRATEHRIDEDIRRAVCMVGNIMVDHNRRSIDNVSVGYPDLAIIGRNPPGSIPYPDAPLPTELTFVKAHHQSEDASCTVFAETFLKLGRCGTGRERKILIEPANGQDRVSFRVAEKVIAFAQIGKVHREFLQYIFKLPQSIRGVRSERREVM
jgi:hypothetical protein